MNRFIYILIFCLIIQNCFSQSKVVKGYTFDYSTNSRLAATLIYIDTLRGVVSDSNGDFILRVDNLSHSDTIRIRYISCYDLNFINLPQNKDTIELGGIPLFYYFAGYDMTDYFCRWFDFACKRRWKKHVKEENERMNSFYLKQDKIIGDYVYTFNGKQYKINLENHCIDLGEYNDRK